MEAGIYHGIGAEAQGAPNRGAGSGGSSRGDRSGERRFGLAQQASVVSCYEAGRDGFWLHRSLESEGIGNVVVDFSSIEVKRRARRAKSDRPDAGGLLRMLVRYHGGETKVWSVVRVPAPKEEDRRQLHRELMTLKRDRTRATNRIKGLLIGWAI